MKYRGKIKDCGYVIDASLECEDGFLVITTTGATYLGKPTTDYPDSEITFPASKITKISVDNESGSVRFGGISVGGVFYPDHKNDGQRIARDVKELIS